MIWTTSPHRIHSLCNKEDSTTSPVSWTSGNLFSRIHTHALVSKEPPQSQITYEDSTENNTIRARVVSISYLRSRMESTIPTTIKPPPQNEKNENEGMATSGG
jgi:hypothetical protein